eukprot:4865223-Pleurochrysis_carterae.AAC.6
MSSCPLAVIARVLFHGAAFARISLHTFDVARGQTGRGQAEGIQTLRLFSAVGIWSWEKHGIEAAKAMSDGSMR